VSEGTRDRKTEPDAAVAIAPARAYEPPRIEKLGSLRDLLAVKSISGVDGPMNPGKH